MKLVVSANNKKHLLELVNMNIDGIIVSIKDLAVNDSYYMDIDEFKQIDFHKKHVFVNLNKLMHNSDLEYLREVLNVLKDINVKILFYDMAVLKLAMEYDMVDKLVICQDHLNASTLSNDFYYKRGIKTSYITSDITKDELLEIKKKTKMKIMFLGYGYAPIFYSKRFLISNYLKYINDSKKGNNYQIISDNGIVYPIEEEVSGTTIYTEKPINLINYLSELNEIDYLVLRSNKIDDLSFNEMVEKFINHEQVDDTYIGFFNTKTIYRVK